jgi:uncharacterized protein YdeI (YjbR/CyaY-like superfamily)
MTEREVLDARTADEWEDWLARNHDEASEIWLRLLNKNAPETGMSYGEAVEVALCFGWIDSTTRRPTIAGPSPRSAGTRSAARHTSA